MLLYIHVVDYKLHDYAAGENVTSAEDKIYKFSQPRSKNTVQYAEEYVFNGPRCG